MKPWDAVSIVLKDLEKATDVGVNLLTLEKLAEDKIKELGVESANKDYKPDWAPVPFPSVVCINVNDVITHGVPKDYELQGGDIVTYDIGIKSEGLCGDAALTTWAGKLSDRDERLLRYAKRTLYEGIKVMKDGALVNDVSSAMHYFAKKNGFVLNIMFSGHGIGKEMHEDPLIPNFPDVEGVSDQKLKTGKMYCIEPILTYKDVTGEIDNVDNWTVRTLDGRNAGMFEHQVLVTKDGYEILTTHIEE